MKAMKLALLGTAALAAASVSARAENLDALKAQIEALNARVATLEATPAVPAGYSMISFASGQDLTVPGYYEGNKNAGSAHVISVLPTADAPAAASAVITWSGWVRGAVVAVGVNNNTLVPSSSNAVDVRVRGEIVVSGKTDTAVGEVGARVALETSGATTDSAGIANGGNAGEFTTDGFWGWWKMTPALTLGAGIDGSLAKNSKSFDAACTCYYEATGGSVGLDNGNGNDPAQIRLSYADGPLGFAVAVEDSNNVFVAGNSSSAFGVAAKATWAGDMFSVDLSGGYWGNAVNSAAAQNAWSVDGGIGMSLGSMASLSGTVGVGSGFATNDDFTKASAFLKLSMADTAHAELGLTHTWNTQNTAADATVIGGGIYYDPVKQLTIGAEGSYQSGGVGDGSYVADLVTVFRF